MQSASDQEENKWDDEDESTPTDTGAYNKNSSDEEEFKWGMPHSRRERRNSSTNGNIDYCDNSYSPDDEDESADDGDGTYSCSSTLDFENVRIRLKLAEDVEIDDEEDKVLEEEATMNNEDFRNENTATSLSVPLIRRQKAHLYRRQKKWADTFCSNKQMAEFVVRELLSNASDAILRLKSYCFWKHPRIDVAVQGVSDRTVLLQVSDNGDGCEDFSKSIMTEGTSANQKKDGPITTGGKGSAKDCFSVQDAFSFESKTTRKPRRYFAGSQDLALEHTRDCHLMELDREKNRGWAAEKSIEKLQKCDCVDLKPSPVRDNGHGSTVVLALAPVVSGPKKAGSKVRLSTRVKKIKDTVRRIIEYTVRENGKLHGIEFTLDRESIQPRLYIIEREEK
eukprot:CAMPEP_0171309484 /NCGR_PEP_ID=MMETSP0816-20121228/19648_1 /TAXON_ID=420281 /ORGANISM="Proboscia inermis, Strain CCAP1064/1" /LENGTH=393 /DNA_ID=CAMNT_0011793047 /DNA_START=192 /DNA_END=1370 /DNA_ORIENTATION=-